MTADRSVPSLPAEEAALSNDKGVQDASGRTIPRFLLCAPGAGPAYMKEDRHGAYVNYSDHLKAMRFAERRRQSSGQRPSSEVLDEEVWGLINAVNGRDQQSMGTEKFQRIRAWLTGFAARAVLAERGDATTLASPALPHDVPTREEVEGELKTLCDMVLAVRDAKGTGFDRFGELRLYRAGLAQKYAALAAKEGA